MFFGTEAEGQNLRQSPGLIAVSADHINDKIIVTEFPHYLPANTAGRKCAGDDAVLAAADSDGNEIPVAVIDCLEEGSALGAVGGAVGSIFNVAALIHRAVGTEQRSLFLFLKLLRIKNMHLLLTGMQEF